MATLIKGRRVISESTPSPEQGEVLRLEPTDDPAAVAERLARVARVEVHFPKFGDGRGFSIGRLLRERYGYKGELRAGEDPHAALAGFADFSESYQASVKRPLPLFRRRLA